MSDEPPDKQTDPLRHNAVAPKEQQAADRRPLQNAFQNALENDEVHEALKLLRAREKTKSGASEVDRSQVPQR